MTVLVLGGRSEIGLEVAARIVKGQQVVLAARSGGDGLSEAAAAMTQAGAASVHTVDFDASDLDSHAALVDQVVTQYGPLDTVLLAFGILGDAQRAETDVAHALEIVTVDYVAQVSMLTLLANALRAQQSGTLVVFSSVAGVRVRKANYVYGSTKAGLDGFATGMQDSLHGSGVRLLLVRPGFVIGAMTAELMESGVKPAPFSRTAPQVADAVVAALRSNRNIVWVPGILRVLYGVLRYAPQWVWRRLPR